jgi:hypothetical protein
MALSINLTAPIRQDPESQQRLQHLTGVFAKQVQPVIDAALAPNRGSCTSPLSW